MEIEEGRGGEEVGGEGGRGEGVKDQRREEGGGVEGGWFISALYSSMVLEAYCALQQREGWVDE
jgi:hypothetical protein